MYVERASPVPGAVVWRNRPDGTAPAPVLPDGCMDLIWLGDHLVVAGPDTHPQPTGGGPPVEVIGLRFAPGTAPTILGVPADAVRDTRVALSDVWGAERARRAHDLVASSHHRGRALEQLAGELVVAEPPPAWAPWVVARCATGSATGEIAAELGWSERTLHRHARRAFGYGTATLGRILRFQRATALIRSGRPLGEVAADTGYADQPHLSREVRSLSGRSPRELRP